MTRPTSIADDGAASTSTSSPTTPTSTATPSRSRTSSLTPTAASATVPTDGIVTYTPPADITAPVTFTYQASDGEALSDAATVTSRVPGHLQPRRPCPTRRGRDRRRSPGSSDPFDCKRYALDGDRPAATRSCSSRPGAARTSSTEAWSRSARRGAAARRGVRCGLRYDPHGGTAYQPMQWCQSPAFDASNVLDDRRRPPAVRRRDRCHAPSRRDVVHRVGVHPGRRERRPDRVLAGLRRRRSEDHR